MNFLYLFLVIFGIFLLIVSSDIFVDQACELARKFKISQTLIGLTVVAFGTSTPELVVSLISSVKGDGLLVASNIIGSNITNICLVLGILLLAKTTKFADEHVKFDIPFTLLSTCVLLVIVYFSDMSVNFVGAFLLIYLFFYYIWTTIKDNPKTIENHSETREKQIKFSVIKLVLSLLFIFVGGTLLVDNVVLLAKGLEISEGFVGLTIVAIGTSLPELITSTIAVYKGRTELGIGNILGSNIYNLLFILGISSFITTIKFEFLIFDLLGLLAATIFLFFLTKFSRINHVNRFGGATLILFYAIFLFYNTVRM